MVSVRRHVRRTRKGMTVVKPHYKRGRPGKIVVDRKAARTFVLRDSESGRMWGRRRV